MCPCWSLPGLTVLIVEAKSMLEIIAAQAVMERSEYPDESVTCHDVAATLGVLTYFRDLLVEGLRQ